MGGLDRTSRVSHRSGRHLQSFDRLFAEQDAGDRFGRSHEGGVGTGERGMIFKRRIPPGLVERAR